MRHMFPGSDGAVVVWEKKCLRRLKKAMADCTVYATARDKVSKVVIDETIKRSALGGLAATAQCMPLSALSYVRRVDDPWAVAVQRAKGAGKRLAEALLDSTRGTAPAILVGYGVGARVVMEALEYLAAIAGDGRRQSPQRRQKAASRVECAVLWGRRCPRPQSLARGSRSCEWKVNQRLFDKGLDAAPRLPREGLVHRRRRGYYAGRPANIQARTLL